MNNFLLSLLNVVCEMAPYLLLGFFIAGVLHVFVPQKFYVCATILTLLIIFALMMKLFSKFTSKETFYRVEDMHCSHCEAAVVRAVEELPGVEKAKASASANTLTIKGPATEEAIRAAVEGIGYTFKGKK